MSTTDKLAERLRQHAEHSHHICIKGVNLMREAAAALEAKPAEPAAYVDRASLLWLTDKGRTPEAHIGTYLYKNAPGDGWVGVHLAAPAAPAPDPEGTKCLTHEAIAAALTEGRPLNHMQRACLLGLVDADKRKQTCYDAAIQDAERYRWLKQQFRVMSLNMGGQHTWVMASSGSLRGPDMDAAVDVGMSRSALNAASHAAIAASKKGGAA